MSTTAKPPPHLLSMPNEVLANICTYATNGDDSKRYCCNGKSWLQAVRLTCKQLYPSATIELSKRFLTCLPIMAARGSLETLLKICKHLLIGPQVRKISMYGCRLDQDLLSSLRRGLDSSLRGGDLRDIRKARSRLQAFLDFLEDEMELEQNAGIFCLLVNALKVIRGYGHSVSLTVFNYPDQCPQMIGYQNAIEQISEDRETPIEDIITRDGIRSSFKILFSAAARSKCCVDRLSLDVHRAWCETDFPHRKMDNDFCLKTEQVFLNVKAFDLSVTENLFTNDLDGMVRSFLSLTKNLEALYLCCDSDLEDKVKSFGRAIELLRSDRLQYADLNGGVCAQADLVSFLNRHKGTLRELDLHHLTLEGSWQEVIIWIRDTCSLDDLSMRWLYEHDKDGQEVEWTDGSRRLSNLSDLDEYLEQKRREQAGLETED